MQDLEALRAEVAALEKENKSVLRLLSTRLGGDHEELSNAGEALPSARVAILSREQKVLIAGLRLGEELMALRKSNEVLFRRGQQLQEENAALRSRRENHAAQILRQEESAGVRRSDAHSRFQYEAVSALRREELAVSRLESTMLPVPGIQSALPNSVGVINSSSYQLPGQTPPVKTSTGVATAGLSESALSSPPKQKIKSTPEEKAERRELVSSLLKCGLKNDVSAISSMRVKPIVPKIKIQADHYDNNGSTNSKSFLGSSHPGAADVGKDTREQPGLVDVRTTDQSHTTAVSETRHARKAAVKDMLVGISQATPRYSAR